MNLNELVAMFHGKLDEKLDRILANQETIMDEIAAAVAAMNEAASVLRAHVAAAAEPVDLSGLAAATEALNVVLHPGVQMGGQSPAEVTVPDPPTAEEAGAVHEAQPGGF